MSGTLSMTFAGQGPATAQRGPYPAIVLVGETMRGGDAKEPFAVHESHEWVVNGGRFVRADCPGPALIRLERLDGSRSKIYGPFNSISFVDGVAYADRAVFGFVDRSIGDWYCHDDGRHYAVMVISPV
jgi:hypothetical protein